MVAVSFAEPGEGVLPDGYRPAASDDVPEGRACGNCAFYVEDETQTTDDGAVEVWCSLWAAWVRGDFYCDRWDEGEPVNGGNEDEDMDELAGKKDDDDERTYDAASLPTRALVIVATEGEETADGRVADVGGLSWREPPLSLTVNHDPNQRVGRLDRFVRVESVDGLTIDAVDSMDGDGSGPIIVATATFNLDTTFGREVAAEARDGFLSGVSMEVGDEVVEYDDRGVMHLVEGRIGAVTLAPFQAIESARVVEVASAHVWQTPVARLVVESLVAAGVPDHPPTDWFVDPGFDGPCALTVADDGRVFGHLAVWGTCHTGRPDGVCVTPPVSSAGYAYFRTGYVRTMQGDDVPVGSITMGTGHASTMPGVSAASAAAHYEHTGAAVVDVAAGEDGHGIWLAGALRPGVSAESVRELRGASLSGDWRNIGGSLELVAALAVNVPGFPVPRVQAGLAASGVQVALVAAGAVPDEDCGCDDTSPVEARLARLEKLVSVLGFDVDAVERLAARLR